MSARSRLAPEEVISKAVDFFGTGYGMEVLEHGDCCARFEGGGGHVFVDTTGLPDGSGTQVEVEGREWEPQIRRFMGEI